MKTNIENLLENSIPDNSWVEKVKWRKENENWLEISFMIAVNIAAKLKANKIMGVSPKNQVELAEIVKCSAQYVNKVLKGQEKLQIDTICKFEKALNIKLIIAAKSFETDLVVASSKQIISKEKNRI